MFRSILHVRLLGIAASCGIGLVGIRTSADEKTPPTDENTAEARKHAQEMGTKGKSHEDARAAAKPRDDTQAAEATRQAKKHAEEMGTKGKSHEDARAAAKPRDDAEAAKQTRQAKKHAEEMGKKGKSHEEAREAADKQK